MSDVCINDPYEAVSQLASSNSGEPVPITRDVAQQLLLYGLTAFGSPSLFLLSDTIHFDHSRESGWSLRRVTDARVTGDQP